MLRATKIASQFGRLRGRRDTERFPAHAIWSALILAVSLLLASLPLTTVPVPARAGPAGDWPMFHYDAARSGYNANETILQTPLRTKWNFQIAAGSVGGSATAADGVLYAGSHDGHVYALDSQAGTLRWRSAGSSGASSPAVANGTVYAGTATGLSAWDAATGAGRWSYSTGSAITSSPVVVNGTVYASSADGRVHALNATAGSLKWSFPTGGLIDRSSPAIAGGILYTGASDGKIYALDAESGSLRWAYQTGGGVHRSTPAVANGVVYAGSYDRQVYALDASSGAVRWTYATEGAVDSSPAIAGGTVYVGSYDGKLYALDAGTGALRWSYNIGSVASAPVVANGLVYVGASLQGPPAGVAILALDAATGQSTWSHALDGAGACGAPMPAVANGMLYVGSCIPKVDGQGPADGRVYAFESQNAPTPTPTSIPSPTQTPTPAITPTPTPNPFIPHLSIVNVPSREMVYPGETLSYVVLLDNSGTVGISASLTNTIPYKTTYVTGSLPQGAVYSDSIRSITWSGTVPPSSSVSPTLALIFRVRLDEDYTSKAVTNTVSVSDGNVTISSSATTEVSWRTFIPILFKEAGVTGSW